MLDYLSGKTKESPRKEFWYVNDDGQIVAARYQDWEVVFPENRGQAFGVWREPFTELRVSLLFNLRRDPFEKTQHNSNIYNAWFLDRPFVLVPIQRVCQDQHPDRLFTEDRRGPRRRTKARQGAGKPQRNQRIASRTMRPPLDTERNASMRVYALARRCSLQLLLAVSSVVAGGLGSPVARAEVTEVRFARQLGLGYLQFYIMQEQKLVEKHAKALGLGEITTSYHPLGTPTALTDALLSGSVDVVGIGLPAFLTLWDRTQTTVKVRGIIALNRQPAYLLTRKPGITSSRTTRRTIALRFLPRKYPCRRLCFR